MTHRSYDTCDRCNTESDPDNLVHHYVVSYGLVVVGHLCETCLKLSLPHSELAQNPHLIAQETENQERRFRAVSPRSSVIL